MNLLRKERDEANKKYEALEETIKGLNQTIKSLDDKLCEKKQLLRFFGLIIRLEEEKEMAEKNKLKAKITELEYIRGGMN